MGKSTKQENYRVVIEPRGLGQFGNISMSDRMFCSDEADRQNQYRQACNEIADQVERHVDGVGYVSVESDTVDECAHCGSRWTEDSSEYNGGCCEKDQQAEDARTAA